MSTNSLRIALERAIVTALITAVTDAGFKLTHVYDGGENVKCSTVAQALDAVFSVDESRVFFRGPDGSRQWVFLVGGNGEDIISDYTCGDAAFDSAVGSISDARIANLKVSL